MRIDYDTVPPPSCCMCELQSEDTDYEWVGKKPYCAECYRDNFQAQCAYCRDWFDKGRLLANGECSECDQAAREMEDWNREPGDHDEPPDIIERNR